MAIKIKIGDMYTSNEGYELLVMSVHSSKEILVEVQCEVKHTLSVRAGNLRKGSVKNKYHKSVAGVGFVGIGVGEVTYKGVLSKPYILWRNMIMRCYSNNNNKVTKNYKDRDVAVEYSWHNYQNFFLWWVKQKNRTDPTFALDKDLKVISSNLYGEDTCSLIPVKINNLFTGKSTKKVHKYPTGVRPRDDGSFICEYCNGSGRQIVERGFSTVEEASLAYLRHKKDYCKELAEDEYSRGNICSLVYKNLMNEGTLMFLLEFRNEGGVYDH